MKVLITREIPQSGIELLNEHKNLTLDYRKGAPLSEAEMIEAVKDADAIIPVIPDQLNRKVIDAAKNLKVIATYSVGYDSIDLETATKRGVYVANTPGDLTEAVGEHAFTLMVALARRIAEADRFCRTGKYIYWDPMLLIGPKVMGKTLGIIGFGRIGQHFARIARLGLNMKILYTDVMSHPEAEALLDAEKVDLKFLLQNSDFVSINCNLSPETHHMIGEPQFKLMKPLAYLINTARGPIVNEDALAVALKEGWIAGAALDVFEGEPKINKELLALENVIFTPHIGSATWEARIQMADMAAENVIDVLVHNKPPKYLVNKDVLKDSIKSIAQN